MPLKIFFLIFACAVLASIDCQGSKTYNSNRISSVSKTKHDAEEQSSPASQRSQNHLQSAKSKKDVDETVAYQELVDILQSFSMDLNGISRLISNGKSYLIFNCDTPSYLTKGNQLVVLKNHIINYEMDRKKDPRYNDTEGYICDRKENIWRINPDPKAMWNRKAYIAFDDASRDDADKNFVTVEDDKAIRSFLKQIEVVNVNGKDYASKLNRSAVEDIVTRIFQVLHHPKYYSARDTKFTTLDVYKEKEKKTPVWLKELRQKQRKALFDHVSKSGSPASNLSFVVHKKMIDDILGDGFSFVVFNCSSPHYMMPTNNRKLNLVEIVDSYYLTLIEQMARCDKQENVWRTKADRYASSSSSVTSSYLTFDTLNDGVGFSPARKLLQIMRAKNMCDEYMKFFLHPAYWNKRFKKPIECTESTDAFIKDTNEAAEKILADNNLTNRRPVDGTSSRIGSNEED